MRVPPETISGPSQWHLPAAMLLLAFTVLAAGFFGGLDGRAIATQSNRITKLQVVVAKRPIDAGSVVEPEDLTLEVRPIESLPEGVFTTFASALGEKAAVDIRAGMPISPQLFSEELLAEPETTVIDPVSSLGSAEARGPGESPVVERNAEPKVEAVAAQATASVIAKQSKEITKQSPPAPKPPADVPAVAVGIGEAHASPNEPSREKSKAARPRKRFSSYAWVSGQAITYGVSKSGKIQVVDPSGVTAPLDDYEEESEE